MILNEATEWCILRATGNMAQAQDRWAVRALLGCTNEELKEALGYEIGEYGGFSIRQEYRHYLSWCEYRGGKNPKILMRFHDESGYTLKGKPLLFTIRQLRNIGPPDLEMRAAYLQEKGMAPEAVDLIDDFTPVLKYGRM